MHFYNGSKWDFETLTPWLQDIGLSKARTALPPNAKFAQAARGYQQ